MTITRQNLIEKHKEWKAKRIDFVEYYVFDALPNCDLFWRHTMWYTYPLAEEKDLYWRNKDIAEFQNSSHRIQCDNVLFYVQSNLPYVETSIAINKYYKAKRNGNVSTFRLD